MDNTQARTYVMNILDRAAASDGPFWDSSPDERHRVSDLLGVPDREVTIEQNADGSLRATDTSEHMLAMAILNEVAIELIVSGGGVGSREEAISEIRSRVAELLADEDSH